MSVSKTLQRLLTGVAFLSFASAVAADAPVVPEDLSGYHFISALVVKEKENPLFGFHHFYVNEEGKKSLAEGGPYPVGTRFLGLVYDVVFDGPNIDEGRAAAVALMEKVSGAEETGGWRFSQFDKAGTRIEINEVTDCFTCHEQVADRDYVFSKPLGTDAFAFGD